MITHARPLTFGTYPSDSLQPGLGPVDPTSHSASHSGPGPLADTMVRIPHGSWRDDAARVVRSSLMSTEVSLATSLYATWIVLTSQPTIPAACRRPSRLCFQTRVMTCCDNGFRFAMTASGECSVCIHFSTGCDPNLGSSHY